ncbi:glutamate--cysteine ligase [Buchnera aphidicola (Nipponaphis monzeni)]|uniref:Glutamate--cysteine ligase n=1 Tax=Buchnera aphidicola (Nipponaphis monzeni) TaxID=2495405 RepID=A0A455TAI0_9GAMM|nr:glutamate--cysteine ligase [Buchnera aphidicola]BBI01322.1 glutamate--cysteine ligase [Buchnera aphidicola (Nipponaphis monzeni)]
MIPNFSKKLKWIESHKNVFKDIMRGVERETLRITLNGEQSIKNHPKSMGSPLTHKWITTDFSENLLEFITPANKNIDVLLMLLKDIYRYACKNLNQELMWPLSLPYLNTYNNPIRIACYGTSKIGQKKTLYRKGLQNRYGYYTNIISGVHYNFSLPWSFWKAWTNVTHVDNSKDVISSGYLGLIRNYYRFGWVIPYFFGASPVISSCMIKNKKKYSFITIPKQKECVYLPWATSLRISSLGYNTSISNKLCIKYNCLSNYIKKIKYATSTPYPKFVKIGTNDVQKNPKQINTNLLQTESEFYSQIRPKRKIILNESPIIALENRGIEYVEIRSLDVNPFSSIGITKQQILFLDLFLIWCTILDSPYIDHSELRSIHNNWEKVAVQGRNSSLQVIINKKEILLTKIIQLILRDLFKISEIFDKFFHNGQYTFTCIKLQQFLRYPHLTYSANILNNIMYEGFKNFGLKLSNQYFNKHLQEPFEYLKSSFFIKEFLHSHKLQKIIESKNM